MDTPSLVRASIMAYLSANPAAADTSGGIQAIWLGGHASLDAVEAALEELIACGALVRRALPDGSTLFARPHPPGS